MTERGMIFNAEMVRAILDGRKTQTRRIVKPQREGDGWSVKETQAPMSARHTHDWWLPTAIRPYSALPGCPYGVVGDRIWVRETFQGPLFNYDQMDAYSKDSSMFERPEFCIYRADGKAAPEYYDADDNLQCRWRPSIHMPRWASRITLEITDVRVERLNSISEADAAAEGVGSDLWFAANGVPEEEWTSLGEHGAERVSHINTFATLWESIYGAESWQANPWVWVIEFEQVYEVVE